MRRQLIYLASPYSHPNPTVRKYRFEEVCKAAAHLFRHNHLVFSPIAHCHPIATIGNLDGSFELWRSFNMAMLERSDELIVLTIPSWAKSTGVQAEISHAIAIGKPVKLMATTTYETSDY